MNLAPFPTPVKPLDPRLRLLIIALRQALYIVADALGEYAGLDKRVKAE